MFTSFDGIFDIRDLNASIDLTQTCRVYIQYSDIGLVPGVAISKVGFAFASNHNQQVRMFTYTRHNQRVRSTISCASEAFILTKKKIQFVAKY